MEQICDEYFRELVSYGTAEQLNNLPAYWLFGLAKQYRPEMFEKLLLKSTGFHMPSSERFCAARMYLNGSEGTLDLPADYFVSADGRAISYSSLFTTEPMELEWGNFGTDQHIYVDKILISVRNCQSGAGQRYIINRPSAISSGSPEDKNGRIIAHQNARVPIQLPFIEGPHEVSIILCLSTH
jgi:hypothetical protein